FVLSGFDAPAPDWTSMFCWERQWIPSLQSAGFSDVSFLPLATDLSRFYPSGRRNDFRACFVGDSMQRARKKWRKRLSSSGQSIARKAAAHIRSTPRSLPGRAVESVAPKLSGKKREDITALATWSATASFRTEIVRSIPGQHLHIFGDEGWRALVPEAQLHGPVSYGRELSRVYERATVNLNATSFQMPSAVNQRVFDVPASGGFLLTDHQTDLETLFEPGSEVVTYRNSDELAALYERYASDEAGRNAVTEAATRRIRAEHTYVHRMKTMIRALRARHGTRAHPLGVSHDP
ncbi:MAG: glycosyltransferase, partial [Myxococcota bacterium]